MGIDTQAGVDEEGGGAAMPASRLLRSLRPRTWFSYSASSCGSGYANGSPLQYNLKTLNLRRNAFGIAFNIDGVLIRGSEVIGRAPEAFRRLYKDVEKGQLLVPYVFLTNGGGTTEAAQAEELTRHLSVPVNPRSGKPTIQISCKAISIKEGTGCWQR